MGKFAGIQVEVDVTPSGWRIGPECVAAAIVAASKACPYICEVRAGITKLSLILELPIDHHLTVAEAHESFRVSVAREVQLAVKACT